MFEQLLAITPLLSPSFQEPDDEEEEEEFEEVLQLLSYY